MADSGKWRELEAIINRQFPNARITSAYRPGSTGSGGSADYHSSGDAIDIAPPSMAIFNWIASNYPNSSELIYTPAGGRQIKNGSNHKYSVAVAVGHFNHIHWAMGSGGSVVNASSSSVFSNPLQPLFDFVGFVSDPGSWARIGLGIGGLVLVVFAFLAFTGKQLGLAGLKIGKR